ncbi:class II myosin [Ascosphaera acerosa]|nr:class II myosin [Ascosphaera acerosa]
MASSWTGRRRHTGPPPPPAAAQPPAAAAPQKDTARALYDFASSRPNELSITKDQIVEIKGKESNGWWLCMDMATQQQGWAPESYLEQITVATAPAKPAPPPRPAKRAGVSARSPAVAAAAATGVPARDSAVSMNSSAQDSSRSATPSSLAGGLAEALKHRHQTMNPKEEDEDDW